jgi:o-succinylbenzoate synthase
MKLARVEIAAFSLALRAPLSTARGTVTHRRGFLLRIRDEHGLCGLGEASPASWIDGESLEETERSLRELVRSVGRQRTADLELSPAARCALDTARLDLEARQEGVAACRRLGGSPRPIGLAALLGEQTESGFARELAQALARGFRCFKLKVGADPAIDLSRLSRVRREGGAQSVIRLDANRAWSFDQARRALESFRAFSPEQVEEPLRSSEPAVLARLRAEASVPIAADESLRRPQDLERLAAARSVDAVVLKLARLGGPRPTLALARRAIELGLRVVLTDSIDTAIGRAAVLHVAAALPPPIEFVGLAGSRLLVSDVTSDGPGGPLLEPAGPGLGVTLDADFEKELRWHG